jgi:ribosome modulation factor
MTTLELDEDAWTEGYRAGLMGKSQRMDPYHPHSIQALSWISGWIDGKDKGLLNIHRQKLERFTGTV